MVNAFVRDYPRSMKSTISRTLLIALPLAASSLLPSCVSDPYIVSSGQDLPSVRSYTTYSSLPADYSGDAYFYNDRYYAGGPRNIFSVKVDRLDFEGVEVWC
jgi:hypothetical protein